MLSFDCNSSFVGGEYADSCPDDFPTLTGTALQQLMVGKKCSQPTPLHWRRRMYSIESCLERALQSDNLDVFEVLRNVNNDTTDITLACTNLQSQSIYFHVFVNVGNEVQIQTFSNRTLFTSLGKTWKHVNFLKTLFSSQQWRFVCGSLIWRPLTYL